MNYQVATYLMILLENFSFLNLFNVYKYLQKKKMVFNYRPIDKVDN